MPATAEVVYTFTVTVFPTTTLGSENITSVSAAFALTVSHGSSAAARSAARTVFLCFISKPSLRRDRRRAEQMVSYTDEIVDRRRAAAVHVRRGQTQPGQRTGAEKMVA